MERKGAAYSPKATLSGGDPNANVQSPHHTKTIGVVGSRGIRGLMQRARDEDEDSEPLNPNGPRPYNQPYY